MAEANQAGEHATPAASAASGGHVDSPRHEKALRRCEIQVDRLTAVLASGRRAPGTETFDSAEGSADCDGGEQACSSEMFVTTVVGVTNSHLRGEPEPTGKAHGNTACRDVRDKVLQVRIPYAPHTHTAQLTHTRLRPQVLLNQRRLGDADSLLESAVQLLDLFGEQPTPPPFSLLSRLVSN